MRKTLAAAALGVMFASTSAMAATAISSFGTSGTVTASCEVVSAAAMSFGELGTTSSEIDTTSDIVVKCTDTTAYDVGLDGGSAADIDARVLTSATTSDTISYQLYQDSGRSTVWGDTIETDTVSETGDGQNQTHTVYGRVSVQEAVAPGADYTDTINVTVTY